MATTSINYQQIAAGFAAKYMPQSTRQVLVNNGLVANIDAANRLSQKQIAKILYDYYLKNGKESYSALLREIEPPSENTIGGNDANIIAASAPGLNEVAAASGVPIQVNQPAMAMSTEKINFDWAKGAWDAIVGGTTSTTAPIVTTITKTNAVAIIGVVAVLAILAFVIVKS